jgi:phage terminase small subunit
LTDKQRRFADEYLIDLNATRAYMTAYPAIKRLHTAESNGSRLLRNAEVLAYIQERQQARQDRTEITQDMVLHEIAAIAFETVSEAVSVKDKLRALELLGKHLGMFERRKDALDIEEQEARIAKLRAETRTEDERQELVVRFVDFPEEAAE